VDHDLAFDALLTAAGDIPGTLLGDRVGAGRGAPELSAFGAIDVEDGLIPAPWADAVSL